MSRWVRFFVIAYGLAMVATTMWVWLLPRGNSIFSFDSSGNQWIFGGAASCALFLLVVGLVVRRRTDFPESGWSGAVLAISATAMIPIFFEIGSDEHSVVAQIVIEVSIYIAATIWLDRVLRGQMHSLANLRLLALATCAVGVVSVLSSLFLLASFGTTAWGKGTAKGWEILAGKAHWVTADINVVVGLGESGDRFAWLQPGFLVVGYAMYAACLAATIAMAGWLLAARRMSLGPVRFLSVLGTIHTLCSFWLYSDIFWGWRFEWAAKSFAPLLGVSLWLAGPLLMAFILLPIAVGRYEAWRLRMALLLSAPIALFNYCVMFDYFEELEIPGLAMLMIGMQLESWACVALLALAHAQRPSFAQLQSA